MLANANAVRHVSYLLRYRLKICFLSVVSVSCGSEKPIQPSNIASVDGNLSEPINGFSCRYRYNSSPSNPNSVATDVQISYQELSGHLSLESLAANGGPGPYPGIDTFASVDLSMRLNSLLHQLNYDSLAQSYISPVAVSDSYAMTFTFVTSTRTKDVEVNVAGSAAELNGIKGIYEFCSSRDFSSGVAPD